MKHFANSCLRFPSVSLEPVIGLMVDDDSWKCLVLHAFCIKFLSWIRFFNKYSAMIVRPNLNIITEILREGQSFLLVLYKNRLKLKLMPKPLYLGIIERNDYNTWDCTASICKDFNHNKLAVKRCEFTFLSLSVLKPSSRWT